jgi:hypothetical protein
LWKKINTAQGKCFQICLCTYLFNTCTRDIDVIEFGGFFKGKKAFSLRLSTFKPKLHVRQYCWQYCSRLFVYFLRKKSFLNVLVLSNIASFIAHLKACANQSLLHWGNLSFVVKFNQAHTNSKIRLAIPVVFSFGQKKLFVRSDPSCAHNCR